MIAAEKKRDSRICEPAFVFETELALSIWLSVGSQVCRLR
jgi:hypothetical protein